MTSTEISFFSNCRSVSAKQGLFTPSLLFLHMGTTAATAGGHQWATTLPFHHPLHPLLLSQSLISTVGPHFGVFFNTTSCKGSSISQPSPNSITLLLFPMVPNSTMATKDWCRGNLAALWGAQQRLSTHYHPPSHLFTCAPALRDVYHHSPFPSCHEI